MNLHAILGFFVAPLTLRLRAIPEINDVSYHDTGDRGYVILFNAYNLEDAIVAYEDVPIIISRKGVPTLNFPCNMPGKDAVVEVLDDIYTRLHDMMVVEAPF